MYRSSSSTRVSDEYFSHTSSPPSSSALSNQNHVVVDQVLPTYNPQSHVAKKEKNRIRSAENAIHLIPLLLVLCAIILWFFSSPVDVVSKDDSIVARVTSSMTSGDINNSGAAKSSLASNLEQGHFDPSDESVDPSNNRSTGDEKSQ